MKTIQKTVCWFCDWYDNDPFAKEGLVIALIAIVSAPFIFK